MAVACSRVHMLVGHRQSQVGSHSGASDQASESVSSDRDMRHEPRVPGLLGSTSGGNGIRCLMTETAD